MMMEVLYGIQVVISSYGVYLLLRAKTVAEKKPVLTKTETAADLLIELANSKGERWMEIHTHTMGEPPKVFEYAGRQYRRWRTLTPQHVIYREDVRA